MWILAGKVERMIFFSHISNSLASFFYFPTIFVNCLIFFYCFLFSITWSLVFSHISILLFLFRVIEGWLFVFCFFVLHMFSILYPFFLRSFIQLFSFYISLDLLTVLYLFYPFSLLKKTCFPRL